MHMEAVPPASSGSVSPASPRLSTRYRASCDRCQNVKVRCSQEKPTCKRCAKKGIFCVYSPLGRMGRPRKTEHHAPSLAAADRTEQTLVHVAATLSSPPAGIIGETYHEGSGRSLSDYTSASTPRTGSGASRSGVTDPSTIESADGSVTGCPQWIHPQHQHQYQQQQQQQQQPHNYPDPPISARTHAGLLPQIVGTGGPAIQGASLRSARTDFAYIQSETNHPVSQADCYVAILTRTTELEQALIHGPSAPPIDLVLEAEQDFRALKHRFLNCSGHVTGDTRNEGSSNTLQHCHASDRPVLLSLTLLAERVVSMLKQLFYLAATSAHAVDRAMQDSSWSGIPLPATSQRRLERSFRSLLDQPCAFPVPSANQDIRIGDYVLDGQVKARAMKRILQLRIRKLLMALEDMRRIPRQCERRDASSGPLDWGDSRTVFGEATEFLVEDLIRRLEALQGGMVLVT